MDKTMTQISVAPAWRGVLRHADRRSLRLSTYSVRSWMLACAGVCLVSGCFQAQQSNGSAQTAAMLGHANVTVNAPNPPSVQTASDANTDSGVQAVFSYSAWQTKTVNGKTVTAPDTARLVIKGSKYDNVATDYTANSDYPGGEELTPGTNWVPGYVAFKQADGEPNSLLVATSSANSFSGFVTTYDPSKSTSPGATAGADVAAFYGGTAPTDLPTGDVKYYGSASGLVQQAGQPVKALSMQDTAAVNTAGIAAGSPGNVNGATCECDGNNTFNAMLNANFATGSVGGTLLGVKQTDKNAITFYGDMSADKAAFTATGDGTQASNITVGNGSGTAPASGTVTGGFFGKNAVEATGIFDVQTGTVGTTAGAKKLTGAFTASSVNH